MPLLSHEGYFDRAYVHDDKYCSRKSGETTPIGGTDPKAEIPFSITPFVEQKFEAFPVKSVVVNLNCLSKHCDNSVRATALMGGVTIHVGKEYDEPILIKVLAKLRLGLGEIVAGVAPIRNLMTHKHGVTNDLSQN